MWARSERDGKKSVNPALAPIAGEAAADESRSACAEQWHARLCLHRQLPSGQRRAWSPAPPARAQGRKKKSGLPPFYASGPVQGQSGSARAAAMRSSVTGSK